MLDSKKYFSHFPSEKILAHGGEIYGHESVYFWQRRDWKVLRCTPTTLVSRLTSGRLDPTSPYISPSRLLTSLALFRRRSAAPRLSWETTCDLRVNEAVSRRRELRLGRVERRARSRATMAEQLYLENIDEFVTDQNKIVRS